MELIRSLQPGPAGRARTALAIGNFDGVHRGHQALITASLAQAPELEPALMCFEPLPATLFRPDRPVARLMGVRDRLEICRRLGLKRVFMLRFDRDFAALSPEAFVQRAVVEAAAAGHVVVGADFRFGARAAGDVALLRRLGRQHGFEVEVIEPVCEAGEKISSSRIRALLAAGRLGAAGRLLGRPYSLAGRVLRGRQLGRRLGFPTANLRPPSPPALEGVFAVRVTGPGLDRHPAVANLGRRPTVAGSDWVLEAHLFDLQADLYGRHLTVEFAHFLRPEEKFSSLEGLVEQMRIDADAARGLLAGSDCRKSPSDP